MSDEADAILQGLDALTPTSVRRGTFVSVNEQGGAVVDMATSRFVADFGGGYIPRPGETVQILTVGRGHLVFPARPLPGVGTVLTVSSGICTVQTVIGNYSMPYVSPTAPTSGQRVGISWSEEPFVIGPLSVQPAGPPPIPDPGAGEVRSAVFYAIDTGSHNVGSGNYWQAQPWASDTTFGGWFYGTQIRDTIPATAVMDSFEMFIDRRQDQGSAPNFGLHGQAIKSGQLSFSNVQAWDPPNGWQVPPNAAAWFAALKAGGGRLGIGLSHGGYNKFASRAQNGGTGALRIAWRS